MRARVLEKFMDLKNNRIRTEDEVFVLTKERFDEILKVGKFIEEVKEDTQKTTTKKQTTEKQTTKKQTTKGV